MIRREQIMNEVWDPHWFGRTKVIELLTTAVVVEPTLVWPSATGGRPTTERRPTPKVAPPTMVIGWGSP